MRCAGAPRRSAGFRRRPHRLQHLRAEVRARVAADRDVVEVARREAGVLEAPRRRERREAGDVLEPVEALLLRRRDELAVDDERRCRVAVVGVEAEDRRHGRLMLVTVADFRENRGVSDGR